MCNTQHSTNEVGENGWYTMSCTGDQSDDIIILFTPLDGQTGLRKDPESMLYVLPVLMYSLSLIFLSFHLFDLSTTCAARQSMLWLVFIQWVALAFCTSPVATALLCSQILVFKGLPVSVAVCVGIVCVCVCGVCVCVCVCVCVRVRVVVIVMLLCMHVCQDDCII